MISRLPAEITESTESIIIDSAISVVSVANQEVIYYDK
jgi:hypothetical protein